VTSFLLFTVQAPLASWGEIAVGEWRGSWDRPSRSAVIGLLGAALGVERRDGDRQRRLSAGYGVAVRADALGTPMQDYHTMQTAAKSALRRLKINTRADVLAVADRETVLSRREYREGVVYTVAIWQRPGAHWSLGEIATALQHPRYVLYAGRRANVLGLPVRPEIVEGDSLAAALAGRAPLPVGTPGDFARLKPRDGWGREVAHDSCDEFPSGLVAPLRRHIRRDSPVDRSGWLFEDRVMEVGLLPAPDGDR
jgi:CRISPR system Cascade subunit CasD